MTTPDDPRRAEHTDASEGVVRSVLWRLRARLVTPPDAERARYDLDRILAAAKDHAHEPPGGELAEFRDRVTPAVASTAPADGLATDAAVGADAPTPIRPLKLAPTDAANEANRGMRISQQVGRVAAVAVLVVGVGGGLAAAVDREGTFLALFATDASSSEAPADPMAATPSESLELDGDALAPDDGDEAPAPDDGAENDTSPPKDEGDTSEREVADDTDGDATDTSDGSTGSDGGAAASRDAPSSNQGNGNGTGSSTDPDPEPTPTPPADEPDDEPVDDGRDDTGEDTVIALPEDPVDPGDLDGFGGSRDCPEDDLSACLPGADADADNSDGSDDADDAADEGAADDDAGSVDDGAGDTAEGSEEPEPKDPLEELAERRYRG